MNKLKFKEKKNATNTKNSIYISSISNVKVNETRQQLKKNRVFSHKFRIFSRIEMLFLCTENVYDLAGTFCGICAHTHTLSPYSIITIIRLWDDLSCLSNLLGVVVDFFFFSFYPAQFVLKRLCGCHSIITFLLYIYIFFPAFIH